MIRVDVLISEPMLNSTVASLSSPMTLGIRIESVEDNPVELVQHVVPQAFAPNQQFTHRVTLSVGVLYALTITNTLGFGLGNTNENGGSIQFFHCHENI